MRKTDVLFLLITVTFISSCSKDDPIPNTPPPSSVTYVNGKVVDAGMFSSLILRSDGTIKPLGLIWGTSGNISTIVSLANGTAHSLILLNDGTVWAFGRNEFGQLGDSTFEDRTSPVRVKGLSGVTAISAGSQHSLALTSDGTVWAWGANNEAQLGDSSFTNRVAPVKVKELSGAASISAGMTHSLAVKIDGTVWGWGSNRSGALGNTTNNQEKAAIPISSLTGITSVSAGCWFSLFVKNDGTAWGLGYNAAGQLGNGTKSDSNNTPVQVSGLTNVTSISAGNLHSLALRSDSTIWAWGNNYFGALGDGTMSERLTPVQVPGLTDITAIAASDNNHSIALEKNGTVWTWGNNVGSQLGLSFPNTIFRTTPGKVTD